MNLFRQLSYQEIKAQSFKDTDYHLKPWNSCGKYNTLCLVRSEAVEIKYTLIHIFATIDVFESSVWNKEMITGNHLDSWQRKTTHCKSNKKTIENLNLNVLLHSAYLLYFALSNVSLFRSIELLLYGLRKRPGKADQ